MQIQPIPHPLTGLFEGIQRGISLGSTMKELKQRQQEREELLNLQKQKAQAEQEYQERESARRTFESGLKVLGDQKIPKDIKLDIYNRMVVPASKKLGLPMEVINDWPDGTEEYVKQISDIYNSKDYSWKEKQDLIALIILKAGNDPRFEHVMGNIRERREEEQQLAEQKAYMLYNKFLNNEITPDEVDELEEILKQNYNAYIKGVKAAIENKRNELLMQKTQEEIKNLGIDYKVYYHPTKKDTMLVNVKDPTKIKEAREQGYRPYVGGLLKSQEGEGKYTLPQKLDDLRAEYNRVVDVLNRKYGLTGGGLISKTLFDLDENQRAQYLRELDEINALYNEEYKKLTGRNAPFLVSSKTTNTRKLSSRIKPSLDEIFRGK